jgi:deoxyribodipyrimidine photolyase-related protein
MTPPKILRLILGDQLNSQHSWFQGDQSLYTYIMMEIKSESLYVTHHIQKIMGFFAAMRQFKNELVNVGCEVKYLTISNQENHHDFEKNIKAIIDQGNYEKFEYQFPDEYRLDEILKKMSLTVPIQSIDSEHFYTERNELAQIFKGKKQLLMESFYRQMRKKHQVLMDGDQPLHGQWNFDHDNRNKIPVQHVPPPPLLFDHHLTALLQEITAAELPSIGQVDAAHFSWPISRKESLDLLEYFAEHLIDQFGTFQDAMTPHYWSLYHSRLSFSMNIKLIHPQEVVNRIVKEYHQRPDQIAYHQVEGFVRQILGWREYMRGIYWMHMPQFADTNFLNHERELPAWYWTGKTKMACLQHSIQQSLQYAYAHHIQRLMVTGNFALLAGIHPDAVDQWYLGIYIDAIEWVEITNTRGMSQFADGGIVATKPYISSAAYVDKMSHYCGRCFYKKSEKLGDKACPFNSLYWHFLFRHQEKFAKNPRMTMMYAVWNKMKPEMQESIIAQAEKYLHQIEQL